MNMMMDGMHMDECPMSMYFHWGNNECITMQQWHVKTDLDLWVACAAIVCICIFRELILYVSKYIQFCRQYQGRIPFWNHKIAAVNDGKTFNETPLIESDGNMSIQTKSSKDTADINNDNNDLDNGLLIKENKLSLIQSRKPKSMSRGVSQSASMASKSATKHEQDEQGYDRYLIPRESQSQNQNHKRTHTNINLNSNNINHVNKDQFYCLQNKRIFLFFDTILFTINIIIGYWLMLVVMTYNLSLCIAVVLGFVVARLIFLCKTEELQQYVVNHRCDSLSTNINVAVAKQTSDDHCNLGV